MTSGTVQSWRSVMRNRLPKTRSSRAARAVWSICQSSRMSGGGVAGEGAGEHVAYVLLVDDFVDGGFELGAGAACSAAGEDVFDPVQFAAGLGEGLVQPAGLAGVQFLGVGEHASVGQAECLDAAVVGAEPVELGDGVVVGVGDGQQIRVVGGGQRADVVQLRFGELGEVRFGVLPGVEDDGQRPGCAATARWDSSSIMVANWVTSVLLPG